MHFLFKCPDHVKYLSQSISFSKAITQAAFETLQRTAAQTRDGPEPPETQRAGKTAIPHTLTQPREHG